MTVIIEELKREHSEIIDSLKKVKELGVVTREGQAVLLSLKVALLAHLKKEDDHLYPALRKEAEHNKLIMNALSLCKIDMENVSKVVMEFFDRFSKGDLGEDIQGEFEKVLDALDKRIKDEEEILYREYEYFKI